MTDEQFVKSIDEVFGDGASYSGSAPQGAAMTQGALQGQQGGRIRTSPAILITVNDIPSLVKSQGGAVGAFIDKIAPSTIASQVYTQMAQKLSDGLQQQGVNANVQIVNWPQPGATPFTPDNTLRNVGIGVGVAATVGLFSYFFMRSFNKVTR